jgi:hypothetical protein
MFSWLVCAHGPAGLCVKLWYAATGRLLNRVAIGLVAASGLLDRDQLRHETNSPLACVEPT